MRKNIFSKHTRKQIIENAKKSALSSGYDQIVMIGKDGEYFFTRLVSDMETPDECIRVIGFVEKNPNFSVAKFIDADGCSPDSIKKLNELLIHYKLRWRV